MTPTIKDIIPRLILDSRSDPTVEVDLILSDDSVHRASVPSGASTGKYEAHELRDGLKNIYGGKSVFQALINIDTLITPRLVGLDPRQQKRIDNTFSEIDPSRSFKGLGANATLAVSIACLRAGAYNENIPLYKYIMNMLKKDYDISYPSSLSFPTPMFNIINGGAHADNNIAIQEFMVIPVGITDIREKVRAGAEIWHALRDLLNKAELHTGVGNEGGFAPDLDSDQEALDYIMKAIEQAGYKPDEQVQIGMDIAITQFYDPVHDLYEFPHQRINNTVTTIKGNSKVIVQLYISMLRKYPIYLIEDGFAEEDWLGFSTLKPIMHAENKLCVGDDLVVTNRSRIEEAINKNSINAAIIKPNQIGTVSATFEAIKTCKENNIEIIPSHRSGETADTFISHLAVGAQAKLLKSGAPHRSDRVEKYNELLRMIEPKAVKEQFLKKIEKAKRELPTAQNSKTAKSK